MKCMKEYQESSLSRGEDVLVFCHTMGLCGGGDEMGRKEGVRGRLGGINLIGFI